MGTAPTPVLVSSIGAGLAADGSIVRDSIDDLIGAMSSNLLIYLRARKITPGSTAFVDRLGNTITNNTSHATKTTGDANFNNHTSLLLSSSDANSFHTSAGGFGIGAAPQSMPNSFSIVAGLRFGTVAASGIYGDGTSSNGGVAVACGSGSGSLFVGINGTTDVNVASFFAANTTSAFYYSYDSATKIHRYGLNSVSSVAQTTGTGSRSSQGTSTLCYPFSEYSSANSSFAFERWALFGKAYLNGSSASDDAAFANLVAQYAAFI